MVDSFQSGLNQFNKGMGMEQTKINVMLGYTLNMGNFQSLRIDVGIEDHKREGENTNEAFERVYSFVEQKLTEKINENQEK